MGHDLPEKARLLIAVLALLPLSRWIAPQRGWRGRPAQNRQALAAARPFWRKRSTGGWRRHGRCWSGCEATGSCAVYAAGARCGRFRTKQTFSRAFREFAESELPHRWHEALIENMQKERLIGHIARDSTAIAARERFPENPPLKRRREKHRRGPKPKRSTPRTPRSPIAALLTGACVHDSQAAIPLMTLSIARVTYLCDLMDAACDAHQIDAHSRSLGHVPLIAPNGVAAALPPPQSSLRGYDKRRKAPTRCDRKRLPFTLPKSSALGCAAWSNASTLV